MKKSIAFERGRIFFSHLVASKQIGENVSIEVLRDNQPIKVNFAVYSLPVRIAWFNEFDILPRYFIFGGIVFQPLSREYLKTWNEWWYNADNRMLYYYYYHNLDECSPEREEFVLINRVFPDPANTYRPISCDKSRGDYKAHCFKSK